MTAPTAVAAPKPEDIEATYGFVALLARQVPEIGALLNRARTEQWTSDRFNMAVANTAWWKATPQPSRQWVIQQIGDPASAERAMATGADSINLIAMKLGYAAPPVAEARRMWLNAQLAGYDQSLTERYVFDYLFNGWGQKGPGGTPGGEFGNRALQARQLAAAYGYNPAGLDAEIEQAVGLSIASSQDQVGGLAAWRNKLQSYAKSKYVAFADRIEAGETVADIAMPYREVLADTLELNMADVGLGDRYIQKWLSSNPGAGAATSVWEAQREARQDPRWQYTRNAWRSTAEVATTVGRAFGMVGS